MLIDALEHSPSLRRLLRSSLLPDEVPEEAEEARSFVCVCARPDFGPGVVSSGAWTPEASTSARSRVAQYFTLTANDHFAS